MSSVVNGSSTYLLAEGGRQGGLGENCRTPIPKAIAFLGMFTYCAGVGVASVGAFQLTDGKTFGEIREELWVAAALCASGVAMIVLGCRKWEGGADTPPCAEAIDR